MAQILFLPTTLLGGILFQLMVFIFVRGVGISCWGNGLNVSEVVSGVLGRRVTSLFLACNELGAGGIGGA